MCVSAAIIGMVSLEAVCRRNSDRKRVFQDCLTGHADGRTSWPQKYFLRSPSSAVCAPSVPPRKIARDRPATAFSQLLV